MSQLYPSDIVTRGLGQMIYVLEDFKLMLAFTMGGLLLSMQN